MKNHVVKIDTEGLDKLLEIANDNECEVEEYSGSLLDNYTIENTEMIRIGRAKPRKYILVEEYYVNEWSSGLQLTMTDDFTLLENFKKQWEKDIREIEEQYAAYTSNKPN